jgi:MerR family transcriptional regulator/heat shock protein HspR
VTAARRGRVPEWQVQLNDPAAPLFTIAVVADLLGVDQQAIRRLDVDGIMTTARPSGNQRRYSRDDIALLSYALELQNEGVSKRGVARILSLERDVARLAAERGHTVKIKRPE